MESCIFCDIINGKAPSYTIFENDEMKVILDRFPATVGDILIIPKTHSENIYEIDPQLCGRLFEYAVGLSKAMKSALNPEGLNILQNNGAIAGQTINHFHIHLIGRYPNDGIQFHYDTLDPAAPEFEDIKKKIIENFSSGV